MMKSLANAVGGKTARACDSCVKKRARWYCAADDAFLCHSCDSSVHSANPLACRHERVRLKTASSGKDRHSSPPHPATWHQGFTRKPRTPRGGKKSHTMVFHDLVPEMSSEEDKSYEVEDQLIFHVPVLNPMGDDEQCLKESVGKKKIVFPMMPVCFKSSEEEEDNAESCLNGLFPTEMELAQFSADVETLLGGGTGRDFHATEELGFGEISMLKIEKEEEEVATREMCDLDDANETSPFEISFAYESSHKTALEEDDEKEDVMKNLVDVGVNEMSSRIKEEKKENVLMLRLDYEAVISTWGSQGTPWTALDPLQIDMDILCCPTNSMGERGGEAHHHNHLRGLGLHMREAGDGGREARVSRYREKRRTRLFSKKIRYEVRKLNAEKRPRMKGRFVKRSSVAAAH